MNINNRLVLDQTFRDDFHAISHQLVKHCQDVFLRAYHCSAPLAIKLVDPIVHWEVHLFLKKFCDEIKNSERRQSETSLFFV